MIALPSPAENVAPARAYAIRAHARVIKRGRKADNVGIQINDWASFGAGFAFGALITLAALGAKAIARWRDGNGAGRYGG